MAGSSFMFSPARSYAHAAEEVGKAVEVKGCCEGECWRVPKTYKTSIYHIRSAHLSCLSLSVCVSCYNEVSCRVPDLYTCTLYINLRSVVSSCIQKTGCTQPLLREMALGRDGPRGHHRRLYSTADELLYSFYASLLNVMSRKPCKQKLLLIL